MARIETKLDGHHEAHAAIDKGFALVDTRLTLIETRQAALEGVSNSTRNEIAISKAKLATLGAVGTTGIAIVTFIADHLWTLIHP
nr:hypothetical protein [Sphingomonas melonis]